MHTDESRGTFEDIIHSSTPAAAEIAVSLRHLIQNLFPEVTEVPRPAEQHADYGIRDGKTVDVFVYICPVNAYVRLGFYYGAALPDPANLLEGSGKRLRHVKLREISDVQRPEIQALITAANEERNRALKTTNAA